MPRNTDWFAAYIGRTRERRGWTQQQVTDAGGPYRQLLASIENNDRSTLRFDVLDMINRAYGWPASYAQALADLGEYADGRVLPDCLRGGQRDQAAIASRLGVNPPPSTYKTFSALYKKPRLKQSGDQSVYVGFDANSGEPVSLEGPVLTNVAFDHLHPMILARHGVTTIDVRATSEESLQSVAEYTYGQMPDGVAQNPMKSFCVGVTEAAMGQSIVLDPLAELTTLSGARRFVEDLMAIRPLVQTSRIRAAFTFLGIVAFGEDPLVTLTQLKRNGVDPAALDFAARFEQFWHTFYDPTKAGPDLAKPDPAACDLLAGVLGARDVTMEIHIGSGPGRRPARYEIPQTMTPEHLTRGIHGPALVFYDSKVVPELPAVQSHMWVKDTLTFRHVECTTASSAEWAPFGRCPYFCVGIAGGADDREIVARQHPGELSTLTNFVATSDGGGQAIFCQGSRARRVWIPPL